MGENAYCKDCGAAIQWHDTVNGKRIALDVSTERRWVLDSAFSPMRARQRNVYTCHFETCNKVRS